MLLVDPFVASKVRVSEIIVSPLSNCSICLITSWSIALCTFRTEFIFFTSTFLPYSLASFSITETLASQRIEPSSILPSQMSRYLTNFRTSVRNTYASSELLISGSVTISMRGTPARLKSTRVSTSSARCIDLPASSSIWTLFNLTSLVIPSGVLTVTKPPTQIGVLSCVIW